MEEISKGYDNLSKRENYKQLYKDLETGKTNLIDYKNNKIECDLFGIPLIKFKPNVTGQKSYKSRLNRGLIKELEYPPPPYIPNTTHLVGSSMYPRPVSIPFINQIEKSDKLIDMIKKEEIFNLLRNQKMFDLEKPINDKKALPSYYCVKLGADSPKTRKYLIELFDEYITNKKKEYNNDPKYYLKDSYIKGLYDYKNYLQNNLTKNIFNGKKIPYSKQKDINNKFKIIKTLIKKEGWNKMHLERQNINHETYNKLYKILGPHLSPLNNNNNKKKKKNFSSINFYENKYITKQDNENILEKEEEGNETQINKDKNNKEIKVIHGLTSQREKDIINNSNTYINKYNIIKKKSRRKLINNSNILNSHRNKNHFNYSSYQSKLNKSVNKFGSTITTCFNYNNESQISKNIFPTTKDVYSPQNFHHFQRSLSNFNSQRNNLNEINDKEEENKNIEDEEIINVDDSQEIRKKKKIKKLNEIIENCEHENKLMKGYQSEIDIDDFEENVKRKPPNFVSPITVYKKEIEMFKKVNPIEYEKELKRKLLDDKMLLKKLQNRKIYERIKIKK